MARALVLPQPGDVAVETVTSALNEHGLCVIRSFDLKQAMGKDEAGWAPAGRAPCICQYVVLLAYGGGTGPLVVTAWSDDHATRFRVLPAIAGRAGARLRLRVESVLRLLVWSAAEGTLDPVPR